MTRRPSAHAFLGVRACLTLFGGKPPPKSTEKIPTLPLREPYQPEMQNWGIATPDRVLQVGPTVPRAACSLHHNPAVGGPCSSLQSETWGLPAHKHCLAGGPGNLSPENHPGQQFYIMLHSAGIFCICAFREKSCYFRLSAFAIW